jgi:hypothetical protein
VPASHGDRSLVEVKAWASERVAPLDSAHEACKALDESFDVGPAAIQPSRSSSGRCAPKQRASKLFRDRHISSPEVTRLAIGSFAPRRRALVRQLSADLVHVVAVDAQPLSDIVVVQRDADLLEQPSDLVEPGHAP